MFVKIKDGSTIKCVKRNWKRKHIGGVMNDSSVVIGAVGLVRAATAARKAGAKVTLLERMDILLGLGM